MNTEGLPPSIWANAYTESGLDALSYIPTSSPMPYGAWPTLQTMITGGTRLVTFLAQNADETVPYLIDEFTNIWETPYDVGSRHF